MLKKPVNENYAAIVTELKNIIPLDNCENVVHTNIFGNLVIVGKDSKIGDVGLFFPTETALTDEFLSSNNLYRHAEKNSDPTKKGYFEDNGRIKAIKFRGWNSAGLFIPLDSLSFTDHREELKLNDTFDEINGIPICKKYIVRVNNPSSVGNNKKGKQWVKKSKLLDNQFKFHIDTSHLGRNIHKIKPTDLINLSRKVHGCVSYDTLIVAEDGTEAKIGDIVENKTNIKILARDLFLDKDIYVSIDNFYKKEDDGDWLEITLEDSRKLEITSNNPVWLPLLSVYREAGLLEVGDEVLVS